MRTLAAVVALLIAPAAAEAGPTFDLVPSSATADTNGLEVLPAGRDLVLTNTLVLERGGPATPLYLDFGLAFDHADAAGDLFYRPANDRLQLYVLPGLLPQPTALASALFVGESEAASLGDGVYRYHADLAGTADPARIGAVDTPVAVDLTFDTGLPLGHQVLSGSVAFGDPVINGVPEPSSLRLAAVAAGLALARAARRSRTRKEAPHA